MDIQQTTFQVVQTYQVVQAQVPSVDPWTSNIIVNHIQSYTIIEKFLKQVCN